VESAPTMPSVEPVKRPRKLLCVAVPQALVGSLLGSRGETLRNLKEVTNCNVRIEDRHDENGTERSSRSVTISARQGDDAACEAAIQLCADTLHILCEEKVEVAVALSRAMAQADAKKQQNVQIDEQAKAAQMREKEEEMVSRVVASIGDMFSREAIREALGNEHWSADLAIDRLFNGPVKPALDMTKLLAATRAKKMEQNDDMPSVAVQSKGKVTSCDEAPSTKVMKIRDIFAKLRAKETPKTESLPLRVCKTPTSLKPAGPSSVCQAPMLRGRHAAFQSTLA